MSEGVAIIRVLILLGASGASAQLGADGDWFGAGMLAALAVSAAGVLFIDYARRDK